MLIGFHVHEILSSERKQACASSIGYRVRAYYCTGHGL
jgi:hypothetical protein